eukprot:12427640-Karenia_brevis.AAC.1
MQHLPMGKNKNCSTDSQIQHRWLQPLRCESCLNPLCTHVACKVCKVCRDNKCKTTKSEKPMFQKLPWPKSVDEVKTWLGPT